AHRPPWPDARQQRTDDSPAARAPGETDRNSSWPGRPCRCSRGASAPPGRCEHWRDRGSREIALPGRSGRGKERSAVRIMAILARPGGFPIPGGVAVDTAVQAGVVGPDIVGTAAAALLPAGGRSGHEAQFRPDPEHLVTVHATRLLHPFAQQLVVAAGPDGDPVCRTQGPQLGGQPSALFQFGLREGQSVLLEVSANLPVDLHEADAALSGGPPKIPDEGSEVAPVKSPVALLRDQNGVVAPQHPVRTETPGQGLDLPQRGPHRGNVSLVPSRQSGESEVDEVSVASSFQLIQMAQHGGKIPGPENDGRHLFGYQRNRGNGPVEGVHPRRRAGAYPLHEPGG